MSPGYLTAERLLALREAMSDRDWQILETVEAVKVATAHQLERLHFIDDGSDQALTVRQRRRVMARLDDMQILTRLDRRIGGVRAGSSGFVYGMGVAGQKLMSSLIEGAPRNRRRWTPGISFLAHRLAITELYVWLIEATRAGRCQLDEFVAEPNCWRSFAGRGGGRLLLKPDAYVRLTAGEYEYIWFVEVDRGGESRPTLHLKCQRYINYWLSGREDTRSGIFPAVLWLVPDIRRADSLSGVIQRLPADTQRLFQVGLFEDAVEIMRGGDHAAA